MVVVMDNWLGMGDQSRVQIQLGSLDSLTSIYSWERYDSISFSQLQFK